MANQHSFHSGHYGLFLGEKRIILICLFLALGYFQDGYDTAAVGGFQAMPGFLAIFGYKTRDPTILSGYNINPKVQQLIQSLMSLGGLVSSILIYFFGARLSRRVGLWIACALSIVSISLMIGSTSFGGLYAGRLLLGMANGFYIPYTIMYMIESAPSLLRGPIVAISPFQTDLGAVFGILVDNYTNWRTDRTSYQIPLGVMYVIPVILSVLLVFLPDSPRFYVSHRQEEKAINAIRRLRGIKDEALLHAEVEDIKNAFEREEELHQGVQYSDMFRGTDLRRTLLSCCCIIGQTASGFIYLAGYLVYLLALAHISNPFVWTMISLSIALAGNIIAFWAMRYIGRRELLVCASLISSAMMFSTAAVYTTTGPESESAGKALVALSLVFTFVSGIGQGPVLWALTTEIPSQRLRSQTVGMASGLNFVFGWLTSFCTPYFINPSDLNWGPKYGYIWGASNLFLAIFAFLFVPETKGRSLEQLDELFEKRVSARRFASFAVERRLVDANENGGPVKDEGTQIQHNEKA